MMAGKNDPARTWEIIVSCVLVFCVIVLALVYFALAWIYDVVGSIAARITDRGS